MTLARLAGEMHDLSLMAKLSLESVDALDIERVCHESVGKILQAKRVEGAYQEVFQIEDVPDLAQCFREKRLDVGQLPKLRLKSDVRKFRDWMRQATATEDGRTVKEQYLAAISDDKSFWGTRTGRALKTVAVSALSTAAGAAIAGPLGALGGAVLTPAVDAGLDLIDEFVLSGILSGWKPRNYFEKVLRNPKP